ncbi:hypothetical protein [Curtobacterium flaccumfaciens]|uniref:hypothetical protein n=1 Tax=Curtobacterium flaccumfaciens TaxID=2035 RepID=UPI001E3E8406|nr:hypothetical protein [Curtobacterium allii]MCE0459689.1 hypothetical protein [Curtobacterium allii]
MTNWVLVPVPEQDRDEVTALVVKNQRARNERPWPSPEELSAEDLVANAVWRAALTEHQAWRTAQLAQLAAGDSLTAQRWIIAIDFCAAHRGQRFSTEEIVANATLTLNEWRDACRKITAHLRANFEDLPKWSRELYTGSNFWPLVTVGGRELKTDNQLFVGVTDEQAERWLSVRSG